MHMTVQIWSLIKFGQKLPQFRFILKVFLFSVWVSNSEERKANPKKPYLGVLVVSNHSVSGETHDFVSRLILSVLDCRLVKTFSKTYEVKID
jgi:hypothetical protein